MVYTLANLSQRLNARLQGDPHCEIMRASSLARAAKGDIGFAESGKYAVDLKATHASAVLLTESLLADCPTNALIVDSPRLVFSRLLTLLYPEKPVTAFIHPSAIIGEDCHIHQSVRIGANVVIGDGVRIGEGSRIYPNVTLYDGVQIGRRAMIHSGVVMGADGFGFEPNQNREWLKVPQVGAVVVGDDVEIGANTTIDCGALDDTVIGNGVKIDNQVMIAHNVQIGDHSLIAGCTGIAGSARIGRHCMIGGYCAVNGHVTLADGVILTGFSMVTRSLSKAGVYSSGTGILPHREWQKSAVRFRQLDEMYRRLAKLTDNKEVSS